MNEQLLREWIVQILLEATDEERDDLARAVADYQSQGGDITRLPSDPRLSPTSGEDQLDPDGDRESAISAGNCDTKGENPLLTGQLLGYIAEWSVFHAAGGQPVPSGAPWTDNRLEQAWGSAKKLDGSDEQSGCVAYALEAYLDMYKLAVSELAKLPPHGGTGVPPAGESSQGSQSSTAPVDVPLQNIDIHVKYGKSGGDRLQGMQEKSSASTRAYLSTLSTHMPMTRIKKMDSYRTLTQEYPDAKIVTDSGPGSGTPRRPDELGGMAEVTKARNAFRKKYKQHQDNNNPEGLLANIDSAVTSIQNGAYSDSAKPRPGYTSWDGQEPWWLQNGVQEFSDYLAKKAKMGKSIRPKALNSDTVLAALSDYDNLEVMSKAFTTERALQLKSNESDKGPSPREQFYKALEQNNYPELVLKDVYSQYYDLDEVPDQLGDVRPSFYFKFLPAGKEGQMPHKLNVEATPQIPILEVKPRSDNTTTFYSLVGSEKEQEEKLRGKEALVIGFNFSTTPKPPTLFVGKDYASFAGKYEMPDVPSLGAAAEEIADTSGSGYSNAPLVATYVRAVLNLLRS